jgi:uncharacterized membrane protein YgcG
MPKLMKKGFAWMLTVALLSAIAVSLPGRTAAAENAGWTLTLSAPTVAAGENVTVTAALSDAADVYSFDLSVGYDPAVLQWTGARLADDFEAGGRNAVLFTDDRDGRVRLVGTKLGKVDGVSGNAALVSVTFKAVAAREAANLVLEAGASVSDASGQVVSSQTPQLVSLKITPSAGSTPGSGGGQPGGSPGGGSPGGGSPGGGSPGGGGPGGGGVPGGAPAGNAGGVPDMVEPVSSQELTYRAEEVAQLLAEGQTTFTGIGAARFTVNLPLAAVLAGPAPKPSGQEEGRPTVTFVNGEAEYDLPIDALAAALEGWPEADLARAALTVSMVKAEGQALTGFRQSVASAGMTPVADFVDFRVTVTLDGKVHEIDDFSGVYAARTVTLPSDVRSIEGLTGVAADAAAGEFRFVPTRFVFAGGRWRAVFMRPGNSVYTVVRYRKTFQDTERHWGRGDIEALASLRIINGVTEERFDPERRITRAEFASLLVRALGLPLKPPSGTFADVPASAWYADEVQTAYAAGIVSGRSASSFDPNATITRQEMAAMIGKAAAFVGAAAASDAGETEEPLALFRDASQIADYAKPYVRYAVSNGIVNGKTPDTFAPEQPATRAEAAAMLHRFLKVIAFVPSS